MLCKFKRCNKEAKCSVNYYFYDEKNILCEHHKELLTILRDYYHNTNKEEELKLRRLCLYLYDTSYADYGHCERAEVKICIYCHAIDYIDFPINIVDCDGICQTCIKEKNKQDEKYKKFTHGWNAEGYVTYRNGKWEYVKFI